MARKGRAKFQYARLGIIGSDNWRDTCVLAQRLLVFLRSSLLRDVIYILNLFWAVVRAIKIESRNKGGANVALAPGAVDIRAQN